MAPMTHVPLQEAVACGSEAKMRFAGAAKNICLHFFSGVFVAQLAVPSAVNLFGLVSNLVGWVAHKKLLLVGHHRGSKFP